MGAPAVRTASEIAADLIREFEGFRAEPYRCPAGVPTIGYGFTRYPGGARVQLTDAPITREEAEAFLQQAVWCELAVVQRLVPGVDGPRLAALADFTYNMGTASFRNSTLLKRVLADDWQAACSELRRWVHGGGKVLPGLVRRREAEIALIQEAL